LIPVVDATWVSWPVGRRAPKTHPLHQASLRPGLGVAGGAAAARLADIGINDTFIAEIRKKATPGTSALLAVTDNAAQDKVAQVFFRVSCRGDHQQLVGRTGEAAPRDLLHRLSPRLFQLTKMNTHAAFCGKLPAKPLFLLNIVG
jgi:hypothetical protein